MNVYGLINSHVQDRIAHGELRAKKRLVLLKMEAYKREATLFVVIIITIFFLMSLSNLGCKKGTPE